MALGLLLVSSCSGQLPALLLGNLDHLSLPHEQSPKSSRVMGVPGPLCRLLSTSLFSSQGTGMLGGVRGLCPGTGAGCGHPPPSPPMQMFSRSMLMLKVGTVLQSPGSETSGDHSRGVCRDAAAETMGRKSLPRTPGPLSGKASYQSWSQPGELAPLSSHACLVCPGARCGALWDGGVLEVTVCRRLSQGSHFRELQPSRRADGLRSL